MEAWERTVSTALDKVANDVRVREGAWAEHENRVAVQARHQRRRRSAGVATASLVLLVGITTPILLSQSDSADLAPGLSRQRSDIGPLKVVEYINGSRTALWIYAERRTSSAGDITDFLCTAHLPISQELKSSDLTLLETGDDPSAEPPASTQRACRPTTVANTGPAAIHPIAIPICDTKKLGQVADCANQTGVVVVAVAPDVRQLHVRAIGGEAVTAGELGRTDELALFSADFLNGSGQLTPEDMLTSQQFNITAKRDDGTTIDDVTLSNDDVRAWP